MVNFDPLPRSSEALMPLCNPSPLTPIAGRDGSLDGFESRCTCGLVIRSSLETIAAADVREHVAYMARKGQRRAVQS